MSIFFESKKTKVQKSHLQNLVALAKADGQISASERELIFKAAAGFGFENSEVEYLLENTKVAGRDMPASFNERFEQLYDLVQLMLVDGVVSEEETDFAILMAEKFGFRKAIAGVLVARISSGITLGSEKAEMQAEAKSFA